ncbi:MAG: UDP-N-acetylglucosamine--N-acetylmuramyl-(pentapeptide) pyrophosphoryl-undecaprenol N-acetylglucosamine transferase [Ruminococcaceae bacterium]|nr:UDP-N-acetylglucosamine--N-acetylmuramyl-(pentapeptide) pyrophosphoryl-undecaprenol N-acetylglucosamine transferase [Oscillospiraceae bacterium]
MRVLFSGGGTGGHISPALAMADIFKMNIPDVEIAFVGTPNGIENSLIPQAGYKLYHVEIEGIRRSVTLENVKAFYLAFTSPMKAKKIIKEFAPDVVIGTGGYVCWPALKAAADMGIPTLLHESNALPGMAVRKLQNKVDVIMTNFESTKDLLDPSANVVNVGNPLRAACSTLNKESARKILNIPDDVKFVTLSFGGSLGAPELNRAACEMMADFSHSGSKVRCYHVGGKRYYESARKYFSAYDLERDERFVLMEYTSDLPVYMAAADMVICRAGAMTLTEIAKMGKAAVIIPSPNVVDNHQYKNAKALADKDAAIVICESDLNVDGRCAVCDAARRLYGDVEYRRKLEENVRAFAKQDVEKTIFETVMQLIESYKKN